MKDIHTGLRNFARATLALLASLTLLSLSACGAQEDKDSAPPEKEPVLQEDISYASYSTQGVAFQVPADWTRAEGTDLFYATGRPEVYGLNGVSPLGSYEPQEFYKALVEHYEETNQFSGLQAAESVSAWQSADGVECYAADFTGYQDSIVYCTKLIVAPQKNLVLTFCGQANAETAGTSAGISRRRTTRVRITRASMRSIGDRRPWTRRPP